VQHCAAQLELSRMAPTRRAAMAPKATTSDAPADPAAATRVLKKYPNRRLYDTETSSYITLADVKRMVLAGQVFVVRDVKSGEDLTRSILLQIILEEETGGVPIFSTQMLSQIIRFYGNAMQGLMGSYLEKNLQAFTEMQLRLAEQAKKLYDPQGLNPEAWSQFLQGQTPMMQGMMGNYLDQSKHMFQQMQEQMAKQAETLFAGVPGFASPRR
jgi:polyhydroxyalkanoate synthesis repressor PhaR